MKLVFRLAIALAVLGACVAAALYMLRPGMLPKKGHGGKPNATTEAITRGEYLARAGDCVACHSEPDGQQFAGGREMLTPFGSLFVSNITPDEDTGIGLWTADDFYRMLHTGVSRDGTLLYPAMPFASYTKVTRDDSDAMFNYLQSVTPVKKKNRANELNFPFNNRDLLNGWRTLGSGNPSSVTSPRS